MDHWPAPPRTLRGLLSYSMARTYDFVEQQKQLYGESWLETYQERTNCENHVLLIFSILNNSDNNYTLDILDYLPFSFPTYYRLDMLMLATYFVIRRRREQNHNPH